MSGIPGDPLRRAAARALLEGLQEAGLEAVPQRQAAPAAAVLDSAARLRAVAEQVAGCRACGLCEGRQRTVPGEGSSSAQLVCVGEGPGAAEDRQGRPFVGPAGQLLDRILQSGMGLRREEVFIANVVKCRPPGNRDPLPEEVAACTPYLREQLGAIRPKVVLALGRHAAHHLLGGDAPLSRLRGRIHPLPGLEPTGVVVTYHPAYLLRNPSAKADTWKDVQLAMGALGLPLPSARG